MIDVSWPAAIPALVAALVLVAAPGIMALAPVRAPLLTQLGTAGPISIALIGLAGVLADLVGIPFSWWQPLILGVAAGAVATVLRGWMKHATHPAPRTRRRGAALITAAWLFSSAAAAMLAFHDVPQAGLFAETYDNIFHLNAVAAILDTGDASSLHLRGLIQTDTGTGFYPAAWHTLVASTVQLTATSVPAAANVTWIAIVSLVWLPGTAFLARTVLDGRGQLHAVTVTAAALVAGSCFAVFPFLLLPWGTLYPNFVAYAATPAALALLVLTVNRWLPTSAAGEREHDGGSNTRGWVYATLFAVAALGIAFGQPRSLASLALLAAPLVGGVAWRWARGRWRAGGCSRRMMLWIVCCTSGVALVAGFAAALIVFRHFDVFGARPISDHLNGPQSRAWQGIWESVWQVMAQAPLLARPDEAAAPAWLLAAAVLAALVWGWRRWSVRWLVWAYALAAVLFVLAAGSDSVVAKLATGLWYKDKFRISALLPTAAIPLLAGAAAAFSSRLADLIGHSDDSARRKALVLRCTAWTLVATVALTSWAQLARGGLSRATGQTFAIAQADKSEHLASRPMLDFFATTVRDTVPPDEMVLGDPWDGSALTWVFADRRPVFPHVNGQWDADRAIIMARLDQAGTDPAVCDAVRHLNVRYVTYNPGEFGGGDPAGNLFAGIHRAVHANLFTEVSRSGENALFRMDICYP